MVTIQEITPAEKAFSFLALLVAYLPEGYYTADAGRWATAISNLRNTYGTKYPHLFRYLHFKHVPQSDCYSPEVSNFLTFLQFSDATVVQNPGFTRMEFQKSARQLLEKRYKDFFKREDSIAIQQMSQEIAKQIKPEKASK